MPCNGVVEQGKETVLTMKYRPSHTNVQMAGEPKNVKEFANGKVHNSVT